MEASARGAAHHQALNVVAAIRAANQSLESNAENSNNTA